MKTVFKLIMLITLTTTGCSNDEPSEEALETKCFIIKEKDTDLFIINTNIFFEGEFSCGSVLDGCGRARIEFEKSDENGEVCISISQSDFEKIEQISCLWGEGSIYHFAPFDPFANVVIIYVDTLF